MEKLHKKNNATNVGKNLVVEEHSYEIRFIARQSRKIKDVIVDMALNDRDLRDTARGLHLN